MITAAQAEAIRAKAEEDRTEQETLDLTAYDKAVADLLADDKDKDKKKKDQMVPIGRLDDEITKRKEAERQLAEMKARDVEREKEALKAKEDWKALYEGAQAEIAALKPIAARVEGQDKTMQSLLDAQMATIPEARRVLIPESLSVSEKLDYIAKTRNLLAAPVPPDLGAGKRGGGEEKKVNLTTEEIAMAKSFGMSPEQYQAQKDALAAPAPTNK